MQRGRVGREGPMVLVMELHPLEATITSDNRVRIFRAGCKADAVAIVLSVLRDRGRVTPWNFWRRKDQIQYNYQSLLTVGKTLTKNKSHKLHSGWPCESRVQ